MLWTLTKSGLLSRQGLARHTIPDLADQEYIAVLSMGTAVPPATSPVAIIAGIGPKEPTRVSEFPLSRAD
jgi:hypothetical protein